MWSFSVLAPTNLQYNSGPSVSTPHVADAYTWRPVAKLKYGGVSSANTRLPQQVMSSA